jgi:putative Holliday junction resolvase
VLAFDFGERRVGVAVGELQLGIAHPLETIDAAANETRFARIGGLVAQWRPVLLVVGLPLAMDGSEHRLTGLARKFAQRLHGRFGLDVRMVDERLTSVEAERTAREGGLAAGEARRHVDSIAAGLILETFFNDNHASA